MDYRKEELFDACEVLVRAIDCVGEADKSTMISIALEYLEKLGEVIGVMGSK